jgi:hypothetical protein
MFFIIYTHRKELKMRTLIKQISAIFNKLISKIAEFMQKLRLNYENNRKWTLYLYLNGQCIDKRKIDKDFAPMGKFYVVKVRGMIHLLGTNRKVQIVVQSYKYKLTDEKKREAHIETLIYEGVDIK